MKEDTMKTYNLENVQGFRNLYDRDYDKAEWIRPGFRMGTVGSLVAAGGSSKTMYALQFAMDIAMGCEVDKGGVLYLPAEDPVEEIGTRIQDIANSAPLSNENLADLEKNFKVWPMLGESPDITAIEEDGEKRPLVDAIIEAAKTNFTGEPLRLVIFDTLRRFTYADENDSGQMSNALACMEIICNRTGASCYFLHHASKGAVLNGRAQEQQAARGSSVLTDNIRYQEFLCVMDRETAEKLGECEDGKPPKAAIGADRKSYVLWGVSKQNYGAPVLEQWYKRTETGVLCPVELAPFEKKKNGNKQEL